MIKDKRVCRCSIINSKPMQIRNKYWKFNDSSFLLILPFKTGPYIHILFFNGGREVAGVSLGNIIDEMGHSFD